MGSIVGRKDLTPDGTQAPKKVKDFFPLLEVPPLFDDKFARLDTSKLKAMYY